MKQYDDVQVCACGAVTVFIDETPYSMKRADFKARFGRLPRIGNPARLPDMGSCNYCVNHWGIDLCACGSGEHYQKCREGHKGYCGRPMQSIEEGYRNVPAGDAWIAA